jgi:hypothetical protein
MFFAESLDTLLEGLCSLDQNLGIKLAPVHVAEVTHLLCEVIENIVNQIVTLITLLHLNELRIFGDFQVEQLLCLHKSDPLLVHVCDLGLGTMQKLETFFEWNSHGSWATAEILTVLLRNLFFELFDFGDCDFREVFLEAFEFLILTFCKVNEFLPIDHEIVNLFLSLFFNGILIHLKNTILLLHFSDAELHLHADVFDLSDNLKQLLQRLLLVNFLDKLFIIAFSLVHNSRQLLTGDALERLTKHFEPLVNHLDRCIFDLAVVNENKVISDRPVLLVGLVSQCLEIGDVLLEHSR